MHYRYAQASLHHVILHQVNHGGSPLLLEKQSWGYPQRWWKIVHLQSRSLLGTWDSQATASQQKWALHLVKRLRKEEGTTQNLWQLWTPNFSSLLFCWTGFSVSFFTRRYQPACWKLPLYCRPFCFVLTEGLKNWHPPVHSPSPFLHQPRGHCAWQTGALWWVLLLAVESMRYVFSHKQI